MTTKEKPEFCAGVKILIKRMQTNPEDFGEGEFDMNSLRPRETKFSQLAKMLDQMLTGRDKGPRREIVCLNAAPLFYVTGKADTLQEGLETARTAIDNGSALQKLRDWVTWQNASPADGIPTLDSMIAQA